MTKRLLTVLAGLLLLAGAGCSHFSRTEKEDVNPDVRFVHQLVEQVELGQKTGTLKTQVRTFNVGTKSCLSSGKAHKERTLVTDQKEQGVLYSVIQVTPKGEKAESHRYYDESGKLRYIHIPFSPLGQKKIYLNEKAEVFYAVTEKDGKTHYSKEIEKFLLKPSTAAAAKKAFELGSPSGCKELKQK